MGDFYITKGELWIDTIEAAEGFRYRLESMERGRDKLSPGERRAIATMKRKLNTFIEYGKAVRKIMKEQRVQKYGKM